MWWFYAPIIFFVALGILLALIRRQPPEKVQLGCATSLFTWLVLLILSASLVVVISFVTYNQGGECSQVFEQGMYPCTFFEYLSQHFLAAGLLILYYSPIFMAIGGASGLIGFWIGSRTNFWSHLRP